MDKVLIVVLLCILLVSCRREESTNTKNFVHNNTSHKIDIMPYYQGVIVNEDVKHITSNVNFMVFEGNNRGKGGGYSYYSYLAIYDSVQIIFDDSVLAVHYSYKETPNGVNPNAIKYESNRSIYNANNYVRKITQEDKWNISNEYTFMFIEQDYLDAKQ